MCSFRRLVINKLDQLQQGVDKLMSTIPSGLAALAQAVTDLTTAVANETNDVNAATTAIATAVAELANSEDPQVQTLAQNIEAQVALINTANGNLATAAASIPPAPAPAS
jgi:hypothetical protein